MAKEPGPRGAYARAGVDVESGERAVGLMRAAVEATHGPSVVGGLGGFGGAITIPAGYRDPVLVSSTDGVGTKTAIAAAVGRYDTIGRDLVAMCADDVVCSGAAPLFFLDYVAVGRLDPVHRRRAGRLGRGRLPRGSLRPHRRRDGRAPRADGPRCVRPGRLLHRDRRA